MEPLVQFLRSKKGVRLVQVNPMHTKRLKELSGNSPLKTDRKDPKVIADIIELGHALTVVIPEGPAAELRRLTQGRERTIESRTRLFNQLQSLLVISFPEFLQVMTDVKTASAQHLLRHYPTAQDIVALGEPALAALLRKVSRGKLREDRARALFEAASESVGVREGRSSMLLEIGLMLDTIATYDRFIEGLEAEMLRHLEQIPYSRVILSLKGIGPVTAAGLIGEVGDFTKFGTISEVMKLAGLDLYEVSSGKHRGKLRISKRGRPLIRKLLYLAALSTVRKGGAMHEWYQRALGRGMIKTKALVAVSRKLLGIIFALVRDHSVYVENYPETSFTGGCLTDTIVACKRGDYRLRHLRRLCRPSREAYITPRLHLISNKARSGLCRDPLNQSWIRCRTQDRYLLKAMPYKKYLTKTNQAQRARRKS